MHILYLSLVCVLLFFACFHVLLHCSMFGVVEFIKHELSAYFDQTCFIPFLGEWRKREDGKRYTVHLNGYQLTPVFVTPNFKISLGKGQDESGGQIQIKWRNWRLGSLGDGESGEEGRKRKSCLWAPAFFVGIMNSVRFLQCGQELLSLLSRFLYLLTFSSFFREREVEDCDLFLFLSSRIFTKKRLKDAYRTQPGPSLCFWIMISRLRHWAEIKFSSEPRASTCIDELFLFSLLQCF